MSACMLFSLHALCLSTCEDFATVIWSIWSRSLIVPTISLSMYWFYYSGSLSAGHICLLGGFSHMGLYSLVIWTRFKQICLVILNPQTKQKKQKKSQAQICSSTLMPLCTNQAPWTRGLPRLERKNKALTSTSLNTFERNWNTGICSCSVTE